MNLNNNTKFLLLVQLLIILNLVILSTSLKLKKNIEDKNSLNYKRKTEWLKQHLSRTKRSFSNTDSGFQTQQNRDYYNYKKPKDSDNLHQRPCPINCNCNYDTINCNDLIDTCDECFHWPQIDFNQIVNMKPSSFKNYNFAPNRTTHIIIYKLLNSTLGANSFDSLHIPENSQIEITFQYNSLIKFDKLTLNGLRMGANSTLVFNFPYTTQVVFLAKCFDGIFMKDSQAKVILRILKSFSVRFVGDISFFYSQNYLRQNKLKSLAEMNKTMGSFISNSNSQWSISTGQFIIDIKSTHLVKFEEYSFANLKLKSSSKFYIDLELVEKLMIQRNSFSNLNIDDGSKMTVYAKQITFIDFKAYSFANINLFKQSRMQVYLDELTSSLCVQRNVFSSLRLHDAETSFNFSIINSKNVQLMHDSFSNIAIDSRSAKLFIGVFNMPSLLLLYQNNNYFQSFLTERLKYLWPQHSPNTGQYSAHYAPPSFQINNEYFYNHLNINNGLNTIGITNRLAPAEKYSLNKFDLYTFYLKNKQSYSYNVSIEKNCFSNLTFNYDSPVGANNMNVWVAVDNIHTLLVDNFVFNYTNNNNKMPSLNSNNLNFILNVKHFALSTNALQHVKHVNIEFLREPKVFKFGLAPQLKHTYQNTRRNVNIVGLNLNSVKPNQIQSESGSTNPNSNKTSNENKLVDEQFDSDYYSDVVEQDNLENMSENKNYKSELKTFNENRRHLITTSAIIDDNCNLASLPSSDTVISVELRASFNSGPFNEMCSCQAVYLLYNQISSFKSLDQLVKSNLLPCKINDLGFVSTCFKQLELKCAEKSSEYSFSENEPINEIFLKDYTKFWEYCITEMDPVLKGQHSSNKDLNANSGNQPNPNLDTGFYNFNDIDGLFSASLSSSSFYDQSIDSPMINQKGSSSLSSLASSPSHSSSSNGVSNNIGKIVGIIIICFVCGIIIFMVAINIIQYKFRNDLLDDLECSSQNNNPNFSNATYGNSNQTNNGNGKNCKNNSFSSSHNNELQAKLECANEENEIDEESGVKPRHLADEEQRKRLAAIKEVNCYEFETCSVNSSDEIVNKKGGKSKEKREGDSCFDDYYEYDQDENESSSLNRNKKYSDEYDEEEVKMRNEVGDDYGDEEDEDDEDVNYYRKKANDFKISKDKITNDSGKSSGCASASSNLTPPSSNERLNQNHKTVKSSNLIKSGNKTKNNVDSNKKIIC